MSIDIHYYSVKKKKKKKKTYLIVSVIINIGKILGF